MDQRVIDQTVKMLENRNRLKSARSMRPSVQRVLGSYPGWYLQTAKPLDDGSIEVAIARNGKVKVVKMVRGREVRD